MERSQAQSREGTEKEKDMNRLLTMGFPEDLATQALAATGGKSILRATEWLLRNHCGVEPTTDENDNNNNHNTPPFSSQPQPQLPQAQPTIDRFFFAALPKSTPQPPKKPFNTDPEPSSLFPFPKRQRSSPPPPPPQPPKPSLPDKPLADRMRPETIDDVLGQDHFLGGPNALLRAAISSDCIPSIVLWGPPGSGKTSIARAIAATVTNSRYRFVSLSAVTSGVKDLRDAVEDARKKKALIGKRTILFVDEVHRFNKSQQDSFLPVIEDGSIVFIGATTENPSFHLNTSLLSRCRMITLNPLGIGDVSTLLRRAIADVDKGLAKTLGGSKVEVDEDAINLIALQCDGDARVALNALEVAAITAKARIETSGNNVQTSTRNIAHLYLDEGCSSSAVNFGDATVVVLVNFEDAKTALQSKHIAYDKDGEEHYNLISALHKSMRGGDANASIYWLARMIEGGEDPLYIARRLIRFASEDVGLADPTALNQAVACQQACHIIGMPECSVVLAQCASYLALAPKSIAVYKALGEAQSVIKKSVGGNEGVPLHLRNAPTKLMKDSGYGKGYIYTPDDPLAPQSFLPPSLQGYKFLNWPEK